ncbi:MAG: S-layer homology domain-containing protein [Acidimicrobiales bacterium]
MASTTIHDRRHHPGAELGSTLWLAGALFTSTICLAYSLLWLVEGVGESFLGMWVLGGAAAGAIVVSSFADSTWSARRLGTTELGNATRLFGITSVLFLIPTVLIGMAPESEDVAASELSPRGLDAACPTVSVPSVAFADVVVGSALDRTASCVAWWGVIPAGGAELAGTDLVPRAQTATFLDRLVRRAGEPLRPAPVGSVPADATDSVHAAAIGRVVAGDLMGGVADDSFAPVEPVTRAQLSTLVARAHVQVTGGQLRGAEGELFTDVEGNVHVEAIRSVAAAGIAVGDGDTFSPDEPVTRAQLLTIVARTLDLWVAEHGVSLPE